MPLTLANARSTHDERKAHMRSRQRLITSLLGGAVLLLAACAPTVGGAPAGEASGRTVEVELGTFFFKPDPIVLKAGERVTLKLVNKSTVEHEFMAGQAPSTDGKGYAEDLFKDVETEVVGAKVEREHAGFEVVVAAGKTGQLRFTVPAAKGTYEVGCFLPGHYQAGMKGELVIE